MKKKLVLLAQLKRRRAENSRQPWLSFFTCRDGSVTPKARKILFA